MKEWNVYIDGVYIGTVHAKTEDSARLAAQYRFEVPNDSSISVSLR